MDSNIVSDDSADDVDLLECPVNDPGAVPGADEQLLHPRAKQAAFDLEMGTALVLLCVDDVDAGGAHGDVVDVRPAPRDAPIMEQAQCVRPELVEAVPEPLLAARPRTPGRGRVLLLAESQDEPAESRVLGSNAVFPRGLTPLEIAARRCSRCTRFEDFCLGGRFVASPVVRRQRTVLVDRSSIATVFSANAMPHTRHVPA